MSPRRLVIAAALVVAVPMFGPGSAQATPAFGSPVTVTSREVSEPGVDIAPDGTIYVNAPGGLAYNSGGPGPSFVWRSTNGGASFTETSSLTRTGGPGGGDSDIVVQPDGHLAMTDLYVGSSSVSADLVDHGDTWITNPMQGVAAQDRQWLATTGGGVVYHVTHQLAGGLVVSKSLDGGITYPVHALAASSLDQGWCLCFPGNLIAEAGQGPLGSGVATTVTDKVGVIFPTYGGNNPTAAVLNSTNQGISFARSTDGGLTWSVHQVVAPSVANRQGLFPVVANYGGNVLVAVWYENGQVMFSSSTDWGDHWSAGTVISGSDSAAMPWVDARAGKIAVSYYGKTGGRWYIRYVESTDGGTTFSAPVSADSASVKTANPCLVGLDCPGDRELGDFQQVVIDAAGHANIVYVHSFETQYVVNVAFGAGFLYTDVEVRFVKQT